MNKTTLDNNLRNHIINDILIPALAAAGYDPMMVTNNEFTCPATDEENNELFFNISTTVPRGSRRDGVQIPYDGYQAHADWENEQMIKEDKRKAKEDEARRKEKEKERKRLAREAKKKERKEEEGE